MKRKTSIVKLLAVLLTVSLLIAPFPASAWWSDSDGTGVDPDTDTTAIIQSGMCGDNLTYELRESGNLFISGSGPMYDYAAGESPWRSYSYSNPMYVYFDDGVTYIGEYAFHYCYKLKTVSFPNTLLEIGAHAFDSAGELRSIVLPEGLTTIGDSAFTLCGNPGLGGSGFQSVVLPSTIKSIGTKAFASCTHLSNINLPDGLEYIGDYAFASCFYLTTITIPDSVTYIGSGGFSSCTRLRNLQFSNNLETLLPYTYSAAGSGAYMTEITLPLNLKTIESKALSGGSLQTIYVPGNVETISAAAFDYFSGTIYFSGDAPNFDTETFTDDVTIYYPEDNDTWDSVVGQDFGGTITWIAQEAGTGGGSGGNAGDAEGDDSDETGDTDNAGSESGDGESGEGSGTGEGSGGDNSGGTDGSGDSGNSSGSGTGGSGTGSGSGGTGTCEHEEVVTVVAPTCTEQGYTTYTCSLCGAFYHSNYTEALGHQYENGSCTRCGDYIGPVITKQPESIQVALGEKFSVKVEAEGEDLTYQWYYKHKNSESFTVSAFRSSAYTMTMATYCHNREIYCVITDANGNSVQTETVLITAPLTITRQPMDVQVEIGERFSISVSALGDGLTYQWYYKSRSADEFVISCFKGKTYSMTMREYCHERQVYCVITDAYGNTVTTDIVTITRPPVELVILSQPQDVQVEIGQRAEITVAVQGEGLTYQWYYKNAGSKSFTKSSFNGDTYAMVMREFCHNRQVYCVITDRYGNSVTTEIATMSRPPVELKILEQPADVYAARGEKFSVSFAVQGEGLTYQWYYKDTWMSDFKVSSFNGSTYTMTMAGFQNGRQVYCVITDQYGNQVTTEIATIYQEN